MSGAALIRAFVAKKVATNTRIIYSALKTFRIPHLNRSAFESLHFHRLLDRLSVFLHFQNIDAFAEVNFAGVGFIERNGFLFVLAVALQPILVFRRFGRINIQGVFEEIQPLDGFNFALIKD